MMKRKWLWLPTAAVALTLAACGSKTTTVTTTEGADKSKFVSEITHDGEPIKGGTLKYALVSASPINGLFIDELASDTTDSSVAGMIDESMFEYDAKPEFTNLRFSFTKVIISEIVPIPAKTRRCSIF